MHQMSGSWTAITIVVFGIALVSWLVFATAKGSDPGPRVFLSVLLAAVFGLATIPCLFMAAELSNQNTTGGIGEMWNPLTQIVLAIAAVAFCVGCVYRFSHRNDA